MTYAERYIWKYTFCTQLLEYRLLVLSSQSKCIQISDLITYSMYGHVTEINKEHPVHNINMLHGLFEYSSQCIMFLFQPVIPFIPVITITMHPSDSCLHIHIATYRSFFLTQSINQAGFRQFRTNACLPIKSHPCPPQCLLIPMHITSFTFRVY